MTYWQHFLVVAVLFGGVMFVYFLGRFIEETYEEEGFLFTALMLLAACAVIAGIRTVTDEDNRPDPVKITVNSTEHTVRFDPDAPCTDQWRWVAEANVDTGYTKAEFLKECYTVTGG